jgi:hypothetical protein
MIIANSSLPPAPTLNQLLKWLRTGKEPEQCQLMHLKYRPPTNRMPQSPRPMAESPNLAGIDAITISMSFSGDQDADAGR